MAGPGKADKPAPSLYLSSGAARQAKARNGKGPGMAGHRLPLTAAAGLLLAAVFAAPTAPAAPTDLPADQRPWDEIVAAARGQTVQFNAWAGSDRINAYLDWAAERVADEYGITLRHVKITNTTDTVTRILAEATAGRRDGGSVDLVWINGENFAAMKDNGLLGEPFTHLLPNMALVDPQEKPTTLVDFGIPTEGLESPWGMAQVVFFHDSARVPDPPTSIPALAAWAADNPGRFAYPQPPDFLGVTFLKQALLDLAEDPDLLQRPVDTVAADAIAAPLWAMLDALHPHLWRSGRLFPQAGPQLTTLMDDGEIDLAFTFNPNEASAAIAAGELPETVRTYVLDGGTLGNTHFLAIPFNASAREGAMVVANFLLSPEAQLRKEDTAIWGDPTVLSMARLAPEDRAGFEALPRGVATLAPDELGTPLLEPHPSWSPWLEAEWQRRFGQ